MIGYIDVSKREIEIIATDFEGEKFLLKLLTLATEGVLVLHSAKVVSRNTGNIFSFKFTLIKTETDKSS